MRGEKESQQEQRIRSIERTAEFGSENTRREIRANMNSRQAKNDKLKMKIGLLEADLNEARDLLAKPQVEVEILVGDTEERKMNRGNNIKPAGKFHEKKEEKALEAEGQQKGKDRKLERENNLGGRVLIEKLKIWKAKDANSWLIEIRIKGKWSI